MPELILKQRKRKPITPLAVDSGIRTVRSIANGENVNINDFFVVPPGLQNLVDITPPTLPQIRNYRSKYDPIEAEIRLMELYKTKPLLFWKNELGIPIFEWKDDKPPDDWNGGPLPLWSKQREIIEALVKHKKVAVKSGHGAGKTFIAGGAALYLGYVHKCIGLTTAPTFRQVRRVLWSEIHHFYNSAPRPLGGRLNQVTLDLGDRWFIEGFATDKPMENITGIHEENIFVIVDEAGGVDNSTFEAFEGILTSENSFVLYIGNPIESQGPFYDAFLPKSGFYQMTLSCYDCPNVKHNRIIYPKLVSPTWVNEKEKKWGKNSALFRSRVLGEFPEESTEFLIPLKYLQQALDRDLPKDEIYSFGIDVARKGIDRTVISVRYKSGLFEILEQTSKEKTTETLGRIKNTYNTMVKKEEEKPIVSTSIYAKEQKEESNEKKVVPNINVDDIGVGGGVVDDLEDEGYSVNGVNVSEPPDDMEDEDAKKTFLNKRAQYYWKLKDLFIAGLISIDDEELMFELSKIKTDFLKSGKIKVADKDEIRTDIGRSPDLADSMMLAFSVDPEEEGGSLVRFI